MPPKRNVVDIDGKENEALGPAPAAKKARVSDELESSTVASSSKGKAKTKEILNWHDVKLDGEDEGDVPVYDDCNEIRRKIRLLQKEPNFKITHWLKDIGNINNNSFQRFMKASGPTGGAENGTYYAAYVYFEKVRIAKGKKKTAKRIRNEEERAGGLPLQDRKRVWVFVGKN